MISRTMAKFHARISVLEKKKLRKRPVLIGETKKLFHYTPWRRLGREEV
jgi:hypothetical protein